MVPSVSIRSSVAALVAVVALGGVAACGSDADSASMSTTTGVADEAELVVSDAWARESAMATGNGAVYFVVANGTASDDELLSASVPADIAAEAQIHETTEVTGDAGDQAMSSTMGTATGMMQMAEVESVAVPAGTTVAFEPGGLHVMLIELAGPLEAGTNVPLTLTFAEAGEIVLSAEVRSA
jgi:copper(I)-binding protein